MFILCDCLLIVYMLFVVMYFVICLYFLFICFIFVFFFVLCFFFFIFFFSSRRRHTRCLSDWSSDVCSSDLSPAASGSSALNARRLITVRTPCLVASPLKP